MRKKILPIFGVLIVILLLFGCNKNEEKVNPEINSREWELLVGSAENTDVNLYHNFASLDSKKWIEKTLKAKTKENCLININVIYKSKEDIFEKLENDKVNEITNGKIDLIILENKGFKNLMEKDLIYGNFLTKLPNYYNNINLEDYDAFYTEGIEIKGYAAPFGKNQLVFFYNEDVINDYPKNFDEMLSFIKSQKGRFTIPSPPNEVGLKFIETLATTLDGWEEVNNLSLEKEVAKKQLSNTIEYLTYIKPYMWKEGSIFPEDEFQLDELFKEDKVIFSLSLDQNHGTKMIWEDNYPESSNGFVMETGTTGDTSYMMIPHNSINKSGAMVVINYILSGEIQGSKYNMKTWGNLPSTDTRIMPKEEAKLITKNTVKSTSLKQKELLPNRIPNIKKESMDMLTEIWFEIMN